MHHCEAVKKMNVLGLRADLGRRLALRVTQGWGHRYLISERQLS
jgi:hypothetical protein